MVNFISRRLDDAMSAIRPRWNGNEFSQTLRQYGKRTEVGRERGRRCWCSCNIDDGNRPSTRRGEEGGEMPPHTRFVCMRMNGRRRIAVCRRRPRPLSRWPDRERRARQSHQHHRHRDRITGLRLRMLLSAPCRRASRTDGRYDCLPPASPRRVWAGRSYRSAAVPASSSIGPRAYRRPTVGRQ